MAVCCCALLGRGEGLLWRSEGADPKTNVGVGSERPTLGLKYVVFNDRPLSFKNRHLLFGSRHLSFKDRPLSFKNRHLLFNSRHLSFIDRSLSFKSRHLSFDSSYLSFVDRQLSSVDRQMDFWQGQKEMEKGSGNDGKR